MAFTPLYPKSATASTTPALVPALAPAPIPPKLKSAGEVSLKGSRLVVSNGYIFPPVCLISGATTGLGKHETFEFKHNSRREAGFLVGGLIGSLITATGKVEHGCFSACESTAVVERRRRHRIIGAVISVLLLGFIFFGVGQRHFVHFALLAMVALFFTAAMALGGLQKKPRVLKVKNGKLYISGISRKVRRYVVEFEFRRLQSVRIAGQEQQAHARAQAAAAAAAAVAPAVPPPLPPPIPAGYATS